MMYLPFESLTVERTALSGPLTLTVTPGSTPPVESVTTPVMRPVPVWAMAVSGKPTTSSNSRKIRNLPAVTNPTLSIDSS